MSPTFRIVPGPFAGRATVVLAPTRTRLEDAAADMGEGLVIDCTQRVVAFHEKHLAVLERGGGNFLV